MAARTGGTAERFRPQPLARTSEVYAKEYERLARYVCEIDMVVVIIIMVL